MKKTIAIVTLLAGGLSAYSQGQIDMFDYSTSFAIQVFTASTTASPVTVNYGGYTVSEEQGNTPENDNPGNATYNGTPLGAGYDIELIAGPPGTPLAELVPVPGSIVSTWLTGAAAGYWNAPGLLATIPGVTSTATIAIAAWKVNGFEGAAESLAAAQVAGYPWGISDTATTSALGYGTQLPPNLPAALTSFSLASTIPEPSTMTLGFIGVLASLTCMRSKKAN